MVVNQRRYESIKIPGDFRLIEPPLNAFHARLFHVCDRDAPEADVSDDVAGAEEERVHVYHLRVRRLGKAFTHTLREWPVFTVDLRVIEFCVVGDEQSYHGLIRDR